MIYIDFIGHMVSDTSLDELHTFAKKLRLKRRWFQDKPGQEHYDLTTERAAKRAIERGAVVVDAREIVRILRGVRP